MCSSFGGWPMRLGYGREADSNHMRVYEICSDECVDEVLVFFSESAQFCHTQVLLVEAPSDELRFSRWGGRVRVLNLDESNTPSLRQGRGLQIHTVDVEAVKLCEWGELAGHSFDFICETYDFVVIIGDRQDVDFC